MARVLIPLAPGFEEIEAITVVDILRRAGIEVVVAGLRPGAVSGSHQIRVMPDLDLEDVLDQQFDMIALPGGMPGADNLEKDHRVMDLLRRADEQGAYTAAICAAPKVLAAAGLLENRRATSYPGFLDPDAVPGMELADEAVVQDDRRITSRGAGTAMDFALSLVENLAGPAMRKTVEEGLQRPRTGSVQGDRKAR